MNSIPDTLGVIKSRQIDPRYQIRGKRSHQLQLFIELLFIESGFTDRR